jgi:hypothetical protein
MTDAGRKQRQGKVSCFRSAVPETPETLVIIDKEVRIMAYTIEKVDVWAGPIEDRPGGLARVLEGLGAAKVNLEFVIARRAPDKPGQAVLFTSPIRGAAQSKAARAAGLSKAQSLHSVRLAGPDKQGLGVKITRALADAGVNLRGLSAAAVKGCCVVYFAFDSAADATKARQLLKKTLADKTR